MPKLLDDLTDQDLKDELSRREGLRAEKVRQEGLEKFRLLRELVRKAPVEALALFAPKHTGNGLCSNDNPHRAYALQGNIVCLRCYLIGDPLSEPVEISLYIREIL